MHALCVDQKARERELIYSHGVIYNQELGFGMS